MKQLTMTKVLTPLAALAFAFGVQAASVSTEGFETGYTTGQSVTNNTSWWSYTSSDGSEEASEVTAYGDVTAPTATKIPEAFSSDAGSNFLKLDTDGGTLFRNMKSGGSDQLIESNGLFVDTDVQFTVTDPSDSPTNNVSADDKFIIWLEAGENYTNLCVYAREYTMDGGSVVANGNKVYRLASSPVPNQWYRLTVRAISDIAPAAGVTIPGFEIYLDGVKQIAQSGNIIIANSSDESAFETAIGKSGLVMAKDFFPAMTDTMTALSKVGFSGEGKVDNIEVTSDLPAGVVSRQKVTVSWDANVIDALTLKDASSGVAVARLTSSGSYVTVESTKALTFSKSDIEFKSGVDASRYAFAAASSWPKAGRASDMTVDTELGVVNLPAGASEESAFTVTLETLNKCMFTIGTSSTDPVSDIESITYRVNDGEPEEITGEDIDNTFADEGFIVVNCEFGDLVYITVVAASGKSASIVGNFGGEWDGTKFTIDPDAQTASATIDVWTPQATINGTPYASIGAAVATVAASIPTTIELASNSTLEDAVAIGATQEITIDLKGFTITGANNLPVFSNAGTLTITNSANSVGSVVAGTAGTVVDNTGTLTTQAGRFLGGFTNSNAEDFTITGGEYDSALTGLYTSGVTGYALAQADGATYYTLQPIEYAITFMYGATGEQSTVTNVPYGTVPTAPSSETVAVAGKTFTGWSPAIVAVTGTATYTAQYSANTYTITVDAPTSPVTVAATVNGASAAIMENKLTVDYGDAVVVTYSAPAGYNLTGTASYEFTVTQNESTTAPTATAITYYITLEENGGSTVVDPSYTVETAAFDLPIPTLADNTFLGWTNATITTAFTNFVPGTTADLGDLTLYAKWEANAPQVEPVDPAQGGEETYTDADEATAAATAINANKETLIPLPSSISEGMSSEQKTAYYNSVEAVASGNKVTIEFTSAGETAAQTSADAAATESAVAAALSDAAVSGGTAAVPNSVPGFYYSILSGTTVGNITTEGDRVLGTGGSINLTVPNKGTAGFYKVKVSPAQKEVSQ